IREAVAARNSPLKSGLWAISAARKPASILGSNGRFIWETRTGAYKEFMTLGQLVGSGPPLFRTRQLLAIVDAGLVTSVGDRTSPLQSGLWAISAARKPASILGSNGRFIWETRTGAYKEFMTLGQMVGSGPPLFRTRQLLALVDAGLVTFVGDRTSVTIKTPP